MLDYFSSIKTAVELFPLIACLITIPYIIHEYHQYGSLLPLRFIIVYSFILYLLNLYLLIILPLPDAATVNALTTPYAQLIPFHFIVELGDITSLIVHYPELFSWSARLGPFLVIFFNGIMLLPMGIYLRYYFKRNWYQTTLICFLFSLSFELIQLSALFGLYQRPYRMFDVDDLMTNTLGGIIGYILTPFVTFFLPTKDQINAMSYQRSENITLLRRITAFFIDNVMIFCIYVYIETGTRLPEAICVFTIVGWKEWIIYAVIIMIWFVVIPIISGNASVGKKIVGIKIYNLDDNKASWKQLLVRSTLLFLICIPSPMYGLRLLNISSGPIILQKLSGIAGILFLGTGAVFYLHVIWTSRKANARYFYDTATNTVVGNHERIKQRIIENNRAQAE